MIELIRSGKSGKEAVARALYLDDGLRHGVNKTISNLGAQTDEFHDIFNYTIVQFMKTVLKKTDFQISSNVNSYLFGVARNLYLQKIRSKKLVTVEMSEELVFIDDSPDVDLIIIDEEKREALHEILAQLGVKCKEVLIAWASGYKMKEIAEQLNYRSDVVVRRRKFNCMKSLAKYFHDRPALTKIFRQ